MKNDERYGDKNWEELASLLSGEKSDGQELLGEFSAADKGITSERWKEIGMVKDEKLIDVDRAWSNVCSKMNSEGEVSHRETGRFRFSGSTITRIAAAVLLLLSIGTLATRFLAPDLFSKKIIAATTGDQKNIGVDLPDGSHITLNRNSVLTWHKNFGEKTRRVALTGEAFFEIAPDATKPFVIDAGKANIRVVGTSFNVITNNDNEEVEVFVKTGKVMLSASTGTESLALEPGYVGTIGKESPGARLNSDPNYLSWKTGLLVYNGQKLDVVFSDLKKVYNMNITVDDKSILENTWTSPIDNQPQETIIRLICASFNLSYTRDGELYHLSRK